MSKLKSLISNLYNRYMDEMDDYEELEDEYVENDLEEEAEYRAKRAEKERRRQLEEERRQYDEAAYPEMREEYAASTREYVSYESAHSSVKANLYDYTKEGKVCCHCDSSLEKGIISEKDQWGMSYTICPTCQFVNRIEPNGEVVIPSSEMAEMDHALGLFAQKGYVFGGFNTKEEEPMTRSASL